MNIECLQPFLFVENYMDNLAQIGIYTLNEFA